MTDSGVDSSSDIGQFEIPKSNKDLKACINCGIILNSDQWKNQKYKCVNDCGENEPTRSFSGIVCLMKPSKSWVAKKLGHARDIKPGLYAIDVQAE